MTDRTDAATDGTTDGTTDGSGDGDRLLVICTANMIRSVLFTAALGRYTQEAGWDGRLAVRSAGLLGSGRPPTDAAVTAAAARFGVDVSAHRSVCLERHHLEWAELILCAQRSHVAEVFAIAPQRFPQAFTFVEFANLVADSPPREPRESLAVFADRVCGPRTPIGVVDGPQELDVADPSGGPIAAVLHTAARLDRLAATIASHTWPNRLGSFSGDSRAQTPQSGSAGVALRD